MFKAPESKPTKMVAVTLGEIEKTPYRIPPEERARIEAMTDEEIERLAESDPDNPPATDAQLDAACSAARCG